jgi:imidazolonepropionase
VSRPAADFILDHAIAVVTCRGPAPRRGEAHGDIGMLHDAAIAAHDGRIVFVGPRAVLPEAVEVQPDVMRVDASGCVVIPGFVDAHTHVVYAGDRRNELRRRLAGASYVQIAAEGGGILSTVAATRAASEEELLASARRRLDEMLACGTTACEAKSGYGLTTDSELKQLRVVRALAAEHPMDVTATFLGAHELPAEYRDRRNEYVSVVIEEMIPRVAEMQLAKYCDVFCDEGAFTAAEATLILEAGRRAGLASRIHAEELAASGGSLVAAAVKARSADHLIFVNEQGADALARADVCAVLLPTAAFYLKLGRFAPARMLIERGVPVALGTDVNPGGGYSPSMPFAMSLACFAMSMTIEEALIAATINAAWSLDCADTVGSLEPGKLMDAVLVKDDLAELVRVGAPAIRTVLKRGRVVHAAEAGFR